MVACLLGTSNKFQQTTSGELGFAPTESKTTVCTECSACFSGSGFYAATLRDCRSFQQEYNLVHHLHESQLTIQCTCRAS